jgi:hypothetical protein
VDCGHGGPAGLLARDSVGGVGNFDVDIVGAAGSLTGDVMVLLIVVVVIVLFSEWVSGRVWDIIGHGQSCHDLKK